MSNYYKNSTVLRINDICKYITTNDITNNYYRNLGIPLGTTTFTSSINENPANLGYKYNTTDISTYCIATYIESSVTTFSSVPSWCNKIRAILVGGGGTGGTGSVGTTHDTPIQNDGTFSARFQNYNQNLHNGQENNIQNFIFKNNKYTNFDETAANVMKNTTIENPVFKNLTDVFYQLYNTADYDATEVTLENNNDRQYNAAYAAYDHETRRIYVKTATGIGSEHYVHSVQVLGTGGAGGGGGGFLYLETALNATNRNRITLNSVGASTHTSITISGTAYTALKGGAATDNTTVGTAGTVTGTVNISNPGDPGVVATTSTGGSGGLSGLSSYNTVLLTYGTGGKGGDAVVKDVSANSGSSGTTGYYRIYYLTD